MSKGGRKQNRKLSLATSLMLLVVALVSVTAVTVAWFTIADNTRVNMMRMDVTTGLSLRISLDEHDEFDDYSSVLQFDSIADRIVYEKGYDMRTVPLEPVTSNDGLSFRLQNGSIVSDTSGKFVEFTVHFRALEDMYVHLTSQDSKDGGDGTLVWSRENANLAHAMRMSFSGPDGVHVYSTHNGIDYGVLSDDNVLFFLPGDTDVPVVIRLWLEGTDPQCTNQLKGVDYSIQFRFEGTDENNRSFV